MYTEAKRYRSDMKSKAEKMASGSSGKPDSSDWSQAGPLDADVQTGERPISRRQYKFGGKVSGDLAQIRADRKPRASGGWAKEFINRDVKAANEDRAGTKHDGGFADGGNVGDTVPTSRLAFTGGESRLSKAAGLKKGGRAAKQIGGALGDLSPVLMIANAIRGPKDKDAGSAQVVGRKTGGKVDASVSGTPITGGRTPRKSGGRTKGKMNVNIIIGSPGGGAGAEPAPMPMPAPPMAGPMRPPMPPPGPVGPPPGVGAPPPMPMARKSGGRAYPIDDGAGGGEGRLEKIKAYGKNAR